MVLEEGVGEYDEFAHDGGDGDFWNLSGGDERLVFGLETDVEVDCGEGRHGEGEAASGGPLAPRAKAR